MDVKEVKIDVDELIPKLTYYSVSKNVAKMTFEKVSSLKECTSLCAFRDGYIVTQRLGGLSYVSRDFKTSKIVTMKKLDGKFEKTHYEEGLLCCSSSSNSEELFIIYTRSDPLNTEGAELVVLRLTIDDDLSITDSEELLVIPCKSKRHHGGTIKAVPGGKLYLSVGDTAEQGDPDFVAQKFDTLWGTIIEIDLTKRATGSDLNRLRRRLPLGYPVTILAMGLRNPWRFSVESVNGRNVIFLGDAGWDTVEKICVIDLESKRVKNFGWSYFEGSLEIKSGSHHKKFDPPIFEYPTKLFGKGEDGKDLPSAVIGGYLLKESPLAERYLLDTPKGLTYVPPERASTEWRYVFGDFGGHVRVLRKTTLGVWEQVGIEKLDDDDNVYSMSEEGFVLGKKGIYALHVAT